MNIRYVLIIAFIASICCETEKTTTEPEPDYTLFLSDDTPQFGCILNGDSLLWKFATNEYQLSIDILEKSKYFWTIGFGKPDCYK